MHHFFGVSSQLPDPATPGLNWDAPCRYTGWPNMVTNAVSDAMYFPEHRGPLSIKCSFGGSQIYRTNEGLYHVDSTSYLILNDGQRYTNVIEEKDVNSFCIFFQPGFPEKVLHDLITPQDRLLDCPDRTSAPVHFFEKLYHHDRLLSPRLSVIHKATLNRRPVNKIWMAERFHDVLESLLWVHRDVCREINRLSAVKAATRVEQYRRLQRAKEFIDDNYNGALTLHEIASVACLSAHHFLRSFKQVFGITPYRYITGRRLEEARRLLLHTNLPVSSICYDIGFESPGSFSWLFRRRVGVSPEEFRVRNGAQRPA